MAAMAHGYGAEFMADGAQLIPHKGFSMRPHEDGGHIDYVVFSAHKMYAPFGCGVLAGKARLFRRTLPFLKGGGTINLAGRTFIDWESVPHKNEAGTPNLIGALALVKAMEILARVGLDNVHAAENQLADYIYDGLKRESGVFVYGGARQKNAVSIVSFNIEGMHHRQVSRILSAEYGISVRSGMFCAHPYVTKLLKISEAELKEMAARKLKFLPGMVRVSLGVYNTKSEADKLLAAVNTIVCRKKDYLKEYRLPNGEFLLP
jgi:selenocysteine lyase/cysteine desulfurase